MGLSSLIQLRLLASNGSGEKEPDAAAGGSDDGSGDRTPGRAGPRAAARVPSSSGIGRTERSMVARAGAPAGACRPPEGGAIRGEAAAAARRRSPPGR
jgi:hypothetical protein